MPLSRRKRRLIVVSALIAVLAFAWALNRPSANPDKFYAFLQQHPWLCQVVRVGFVLAGKQDEFDTEIAFASLDEILIIDYAGPPMPQPHLLQLDGQDPPSPTQPAVP